MTEQDKINSALFIHCGSGHVDNVKLLIEEGANVNSIHLYGRTPLHEACTGGHTEIVKLLLDKEADPHIANPLWAATCYDHHEIVKLLVERHPSLLIVPKGHQSPLHNACFNGNAKTVRYLIRKGADIHAREKLGETPLFDACMLGHTRIVRLLLNAGATANDQQSTAGRTPLEIACNGGFDGVSRLLIKAGCTLSQLTEEICREENVDIIWMLLEAGAKPIDHPIVRKALAIIKKRHIEKHATLSDHLTSLIIR